ncbi:MAG: molybdopterin-dependent oxidoreductase [Lachnospiraceae bacterium]|nr:molybdopterin-dependent oxidoreductase [Lachnospiraceae bacterium]
MKVVNKPIRKKDAMALVTGKPVYTDDIAPKDCLVVKLLRSPHAHAWMEDIDVSKAMKVPGIEAVYTYKDVPQKRFTMAGQTYPEPSPYDRLILDQRVRFVGDPVAIIAGKDEKSVDRAMKLIKVQYQVLEPILDFHQAKDSHILIHPEENWEAKCPVGADNQRNLAASERSTYGEYDKVMDECDIVVEGTYHTKANNQTPMETFRTYTYMDTYGRLNVVSSTQIVFHIRRILGHALDIPKSKIRVIKPRIGGGFGSKQTAVAEVYPAFVTWKTGKPAKLIYTREESQIQASPRHEMEVSCKIGATKDGHIRAIGVYTLSNTGAFGEHGPTTVGLSGHKSISLYGDLEAYRFDYDVVYTNVQAAGAYRGYGATQGIFAVESTVNKLAAELNIDPVKIREMNMVKEGEKMPSYYGETAESCALDRCLARAKEMIKWDEKFPCKDMGNGKVRSVGVSLAMQGSAISGCDVGGATIKLNDDGFYVLTLGAADMGTGCDTILAQMAAEELECDVDRVISYSADTDISPYDSGSYASSTTYVTGLATMQAANQLKEAIIKTGADMLDVEDPDLLEFDGDYVRNLEDGRKVSLIDIATKSMVNNNQVFQFTANCSSPVSPPPYMVGMAEIEVDKETGHVELIDYAAVVDCGTVVNPNLARVQAEGGIVQGIGMVLSENISYTKKGKLRENSFMQYKIPTRLDMGRLRVEFESSYEPTGPYGAKSIGEVVINTPLAALTHAIYNATGLRFYELPITPEQIAMGILEHEN